MSLVARLWFVAAVLSGAVLVVLPAISLAAETHHVTVVDNAYDDGNSDGNDAPATTVVTAGDAVVWRWDGENQHTVTARADAPVQFDSDADCGEDKTECRSAGNIFVVRFDEPGTYPYHCRIHSSGNGFFPTDMRGTIEVQPAPEPSESDSGASEPSSEQTSEQPPSQEPSSEPEAGGSTSAPPEEPDPEPTSEGAQEPRDEPDDPPEDDRPPRRAVGPGFGVGEQPRDTPTGPGPQVAPEAAPGPSFSPFPSAPDLPSESETEDMAVTVPSRGGGPSRGVVVGVAVVSVLGSAGAFGKVVLFGQPWG